MFYSHYFRIVGYLLVVDASQNDDASSETGARPATSRRKERQRQWQRHLLLLVPLLQEDFFLLIFRGAVRSATLHRYVRRRPRRQLFCLEAQQPVLAALVQLAVKDDVRGPRIQG